MNRILFSHAALDSSSLNVINTTLCINEILKIIGSIFLIIFLVVMVVFIIYVIRDILSKVKEEGEEREKGRMQKKNKGLLEGIKIAEQCKKIIDEGRAKMVNNDDKKI